MGPRAPAAELWGLTDHCCRVCFARVLRSADTVPVGDGHGHRWRCSSCGITGASTAPSCVCACGMRLNGDRDAGIRCERNTPTAEFPSEVVAAQVDTPVLTSNQSVTARFTNGGAPLFEPGPAPGADRAPRST